MLGELIKEVIQENPDIKIILSDAIIEQHIKGHEKPKGVILSREEKKILIKRVLIAYNIYGKN